MDITPKQLTELLTSTTNAGLSVLVTGAPGIGKSDIVSQAAVACGADLIISHPAVADPTDAKGLPWPKTGTDEATFLPFGELAQAIKATKKTFWFLDDLGQASPAVQASFMQLLLARRVNGHVLPDCVTFVAATNRRTDRAGVSGILEPVKSRFVTIVNLVATIDDWCSWAFSNNVSPTLIAFLRYRPELLSKFEASADLTNSPVPRTWSHLAKLEALQMRQQIELVAFAGSVGEGAATEYLAFRQMASSLINLDAILLNPDTANVPDKPNELYATAVGLASRANDKTFSRIGIYANRMIDAQHGEFAVMMIRDAVRRDAKLTYTDTFVRLNSGPLGELITGQN